MALTCDYLIVGAGAQGIAFADALLHGKSGHKVIIVDSHNNPGGQWNDTYAFARLDHPSRFYGVQSQCVEEACVEEAKLNCTGKLAECASRDQILSYFKRVMEHLIKKGNVRYFPNCTAQIMGTGLAKTTVRLTPCFELDKVNKVRNVRVHGKVVYSQFSIIQTSLPYCAFSFKVDTGVCIVRPNELTYNTVAQRPMYVVIGAGRTGIDTILWLLSHQILPQSVHWVMPRDSWFLCREQLESMANSHMKHHELPANAASIEALFLAFERAGLFCRIDEQHFPTISPRLYLSKDDLTALRTVQNIIRSGHVRKVTTELLELDSGFSQLREGALCIDCTSQSKKCEKENAPVFTKFQIVLQPVAEVWGSAAEQNVSFHAGFIGFLERIYPGNEEIKNALCTPVNFSDHYSTYFRKALMHMQNRHKVWNDQRMFIFLMGRPSFHKAMAQGDLRKFFGKQWGKDSIFTMAQENLAKILNAEDSIPAAGPNFV